MKIGYLKFQYRQDPSAKSVNIGDNVQSIATRTLLIRLGFPPDDLVAIDRDSTATYAGEPVSLVMNGVFPDHCFPLSDSIRPVFFGFRTPKESTVKKHREYFLKHSPIGCRDLSTATLFMKYKVPAYCTGCLTLTLPRYTGVRQGGPVIAFGAGAGALPENFIEKIPKSILERARLVYQREDVASLPLSDDSIIRFDTLAEHYLDMYRNASLVVTPLLHVASPCVGLGTPVVVIRKDIGGRFSALERIVSINLAENRGADVDWTGIAPDISGIKILMETHLLSLINPGRSILEDIRSFNEFYPHDSQPKESIFKGLRMRLMKPR